MKKDGKRVVLVTGGAVGIGYAVAERFLENGDIAVITDIKESAGKAAEAALSKKGEATFVQSDVSIEEDCKSVVDYCKKRYGRIDVLVNNAGLPGISANIIEQNMSDIERVIKINVLGMIQMIKYTAGLMKENGKGVVINIGSIDGIIANQESVAYHASKGAVRMITQCTARELSGFGIRVVSVAPGWARTSLHDPNREAYGAALHMKNRIIEPEEIAGVIYLLSGDEASAINGTTVMADDGYSAFKL